jgi:hypothetical protein
MLKRNNFYLLILAEIFFLFFILIIIPGIFLIERTGVSETSFENILPLDFNHTYTQSFTSDKNNLNSVSVLIKNPALKSNDQVKLELQNSHKDVIQSLNISGQGIEDPGWIKLKFSPINSQKGDIFYLKITSNAKHDNDLYIYGNNKNQTLNFKTTYKSSGLINSLKENLSYRKETIVKSSHLYLISYLIILIITNIFIFLSL